MPPIIDGTFFLKRNNNQFGPLSLVEIVNHQKQIEMNKRKCILAALVALVVMAGCGKKVDVALGTSTVSIAPQGDSVEVVLTSNGDWTVDAYPDWLTVNPTSGNGNATLMLSAPLNSSDATRSGEVKVSTKDNTATLTVSQEAMENDFITVSPESIDCNVEGGTFTVTVNSNCDWAVNTSADWLSCEPSSGTGNGTVAVNITPIEGDVEVRETDIIFTGVENLLLPVHVVQHAPIHYTIGIDPTILAFDYMAGEQTVNVLCEGGWTASTEEDWIALGATSGNGNTALTVAVTENESETQAREGKVKFISESDDFVFLNIKQDVAPDPHYLEVTPTTVELDKDGGTAEVSINCDEDWTASVQANWVALSATSGSGNGTITLTAEPNPISEMRVTTLTVISGPLSQYVTIRQAAGEEPVAITVSPDTLYAAYSGGFVQFSIAANSNWTLTTSDGWITLTTASGSGNANLSIAVDQNNSAEQRIGVVNIMHNFSVMAMLIVVQEGRPVVLETDVTEINAPAEGGSYTVVVTSNQTWNIETSMGWLTCTPSSGNGNGEFLVKITPLVSVDRSAEIHIYGSYGSHLVIPVTQTR